MSVEKNSEEIIPKVKPAGSIWMQLSQQADIKKANFAGILSRSKFLHHYAVPVQLHLRLTAGS